VRRTVIAVAVLVGGLWIAAHYPDLAWVGVLGVVLAYFVAPGRKKSKSRSGKH